MRGLPAQAWLYYCMVVGLAAALIGMSPFHHIDPTTLLVLAVLFVVCESAPVPLSVQRAKVSLSFAASLAAVVLVGPVGAALVGASAILTAHRRVAPLKRLFNGAQFALSGYTAARAYCMLGGYHAHLGRPGWVTQVLGPFAAALVTFVGVNLLLMGGILIIARQATWQETLAEAGPLMAGCLGFGVLGLLIAAIWPLLGPLAAVLVLLPLFVARWAFAQLHAQQEAHDATIAALCQAVETKDFYTRGHSERVSRGSVMIARMIGMRPARTEAIRYAGMLHDVGKLGVPTKVLQKDGDLSEEEFAAIQLHPMRGLEIVRDIGFLDEALAGIMHHHEKMDGTGYPMGLAGSEIPEFARVISVADAFDSMTSTRSYRKARSVADGIAELRNCAGTHFDPQFVDAFVAAVAQDGWVQPDVVEPAEGEDVETTKQDHDDPSTPLRVAGDGVRP
jgi:HD superfamily phosphohydrolase YqeK